MNRLLIPDWRQNAARLIACAAIVWTLYEVGGAVLNGISIIFWRTECQQRSWVATVAGWSLPAVLIVSLWLQAKVIRRPSVLVLLASILLPVVTWWFHGFATIYEEKQLSMCIARPLSEAVKVCNVNLAVYRETLGYNGKPVFTIIPPGDTDEALSCFRRWADWSNKAEVNIDDPVYVHYRQTLR